MLHPKKTKIMTTGTLNEFILDGTETEITNCYIFLGTIITRDGYDHKLLTLSLLMLYIYEAPSKARNLTSYIYG
jgi:hypothetical protein